MRLNLGCGSNKRDGFVNVDLSPLCDPDMVWNLEETPWPWPDSSVSEVVLIHVLEHLGETTEKYFNVLRSMLWCPNRAMMIFCTMRPMCAP